MARDLHHTEGLILAKVPRGEASFIFTVFTRELGLIRALAQSVRAGRSKLRSQLQVGWVVNLDLVRSRDGWRLIGAMSSRKVLPSTKAAQSAVANLAILLRRLLPLEEPQPELFQDVVNALKIFDQIVSEDLEALLALRLLNYLGYFDPAPDFARLAVGEELSPEAVKSFSPNRQKAIRLINESLTASHL